MDILKSMIESGLITEEEIREADERQKQREKEIEAHRLEWKDWLEENMPFVNGYLENERMFNMLKNIDQDNILIVKPTKTNLNQIIQFSKSKYNEFKKSDYVSYCFEAIKNASTDNPFDSVMQTTTGCFSAGAHGHGGKKGSPRFNAKFTTSGTYEMVVPFGMPFLILDEKKIVMFEGFDYNPVKIDQTIMDKYQNYKEGKPESLLPF